MKDIKALNLKEMEQVTGGEILANSTEAEMDSLLADGHVAIAAAKCAQRPDPIVLPRPTASTGTTRPTGSIGTGSRPIEIERRKIYPN